MSPEKRSRCMANIRSSNTEPELLLRKHIWALGLRYRKHAALPGRPDLAFIGCRVAVFVDGCFWHGCPEHSKSPSSNKRYWGPKLKRNRARDKCVNLELAAMRWMVMRFWEHEVRASASRCARRVATKIAQRRRSLGIAREQ